MLQDENAQPQQIGLYNAHRAAQLLYGKNYGLQIESVYGKGTQVVLRLPLVRGELSVQGIDR